MSGWNEPVYQVRKDVFRSSFEVEKELKRSSTSLVPEDQWYLVDKQRFYLRSSISHNTVAALQTELDDQVIRGTAQVSEGVSSTAADGSKHPPVTEQNTDSGTSEFRSVTRVLERSNYRPTSNQAATIQARLTDKNLVLAQIDRDILRLQLHINEAVLAVQDLEKKRIKAQTEANFYESWLIPVRLLPLEILTRIFKFAIKSHGHSRSFYGTSPFIISQVCSSWRNAVLSCSSFWNELELPLLYYDDRSSSRGNFLNLWYNRANASRPLKLHLAAIGKNDSGVKGPGFGEDLAAGIAPFASLIASLDITTNISSGHPPRRNKIHIMDLKGFFTMPNDTFSSLKTFTYTDYSDGELDFSTSEDYPLISFLARSPNLQEVTLRIPQYMAISTPRLLLPWKQLTKLYVGGRTSVHSFVAIFFQCTQLQTVDFPSLDLGDYSNPDEPPIPTAPVTFPNLTEFTVGLAGPGIVVLVNMEQLFRVIDLPCVERVNVAGGAYSFSSIHAVFFPLFDLLPLDVPWSSGMLPPLRHVKLVYADMSVEDILCILSCPALESLVLCISGIGPMQQLEALTHSSRSQADSSGDAASGHRTLPPTALLNLKSFIFGYVVIDDGEDEVHDFRAFSEAFFALVNLWAARGITTIPKRFAVELLVCDGNNLGGPSVKEAFPEIITRVKEGIEGLVDVQESDADDKNAANDTPGGVTFKASLLSSYDKLLSALDIVDRTKPSDFLALY